MYYEVEKEDELNVILDYGEYDFYIACFTSGSDEVKIYWMNVCGYAYDGGMDLFGTYNLRTKEYTVHDKETSTAKRKDWGDKIERVLELEKKFFVRGDNETKSLD